MQKEAISSLGLRKDTEHSQLSGLTDDNIQS